MGAESAPKESLEKRVTRAIEPKITGNVKIRTNTTPRKSTPLDRIRQNQYNNAKKTERKTDVDKQFERTGLLIGEEGVQKLSDAKVCVFGLGGVGGYVIEALTRASIGALDIVDNDVVDETNLNRQVLATWETIGKSKVEVAEERIRSINPNCDVTKHNCFYLPENRGEFDFSSYDYVVDAVDTTTAKLDIIEASIACGTPVISSMGTGNKLDPGQLRVTDISKTSIDGLAKVMRKELRKRGINHVKCVFSTEPSITPGIKDQAVQMDASDSVGISQPGPTLEHPGQAESITHGRKKLTPGSISFVPSVAGMLIAGEVVKDLLDIM
jgi:tRNA threonylcarbamoyladenosine dehydratase